MRWNCSRSYARGGIVVLALLAGCSGGGGLSAPVSSSLAPLQTALRSANAIKRQMLPSSSVLPPGKKTKIRPDHSRSFALPDAAQTGAVVVSDDGTNDVYAYSLSGKLVATITGLNEPQGLAADLKGDIFIANTLDNNILVYKNDYSTLLQTLNDPGEYPSGVAYDPTTGTTGVTNIISASDTAGSVSIYAKNATTPCVTVSNSTFFEVFFGAFNAKGQLFVDGFDASGNVVVGVVSGGCKAKTITNLTIGNTIGFPGGVQVNSSGQIVIGDQDAATLYTYTLSKNALGAPTATTPLTGASDAVTFSFTRPNATAWTADAGLGAAQAFAYPAGGSPVKTITGFAQPIGVVVTPVERP